MPQISNHGCSVEGYQISSFLTDNFNNGKHKQLQRLSVSVNP